MRNKTTNELVALAKGNNYDATMELWNRVSASVKNTHEYGKVGTRCSRGARSKYAASFEEMSGELYLVFLKCVENYDASRGASFETFLNFKVKMFAEDQIRNNRKKVTRKGEKMDVRFVSYEKLQNLLDGDKGGKTEDEENLGANIDCSRLDLDKTDAAVNGSDCTDRYNTLPEGISEEDAELSDTAKTLPNGRTYLLGAYKMGRHDLTKEKVNEIMDIFETGSREMEVIETYIRLARHTGETPTVREVGKELGIEGAAVSARMKVIRKALDKAGIRL